MEIEEPGEDNLDSSDLCLEMGIGHGDLEIMMC
jgi:hypothetical protein